MKVVVVFGVGNLRYATARAVSFELRNFILFYIGHANANANFFQERFDNIVV